MGSETVQSLLQEVQKKGGSLQANDEQSRKDLLVAAQALVAELETPAERVANWSWYEVRILQYVWLCLLADSPSPQ